MSGYHVTDQDLDIFEDVAVRMDVPWVDLVIDAEEDTRTHDHRMSVNQDFWRLRIHGSFREAVRAETREIE